MFSIPLPDLNQSGLGELYTANVKRLATATSVVTIDSNHFCVANLVGQRLYLYEFDHTAKIYKMLDWIDTRFNKKLAITDLMDYDGKNLIAVSNLHAASQTIYKITNNKLSHYKDIPKTDPKNQNCHGIRFYPSSNHTIIVATYLINPNIAFINYKTNKVVYKITYNPLYLPKDIFFIDQNHMLAVYTSGRILGKSTKNKYESKVVLYKIDIVKKTHQEINTITVPDSHSDSIVYHRGIIFTVNQMRSQIVVIHLDNSQLKFLTTLDGYSKPHGVAVEPKNNLILVTNYGDNTVKIRGIPENITSKFTF